MTQCDAILEHLQTGATVTPTLAYERFGCLALHSRINDLRKAGHNIACRIATRGKQRWGEYTLAPRSSG